MQEALNVRGMYLDLARHSAVGIDTMNEPRHCPSQVGLSLVLH